jgi:hypothetical protein
LSALLGDDAHATRFGGIKTRSLALLDAQNTSHPQAIRSKTSQTKRTNIFIHKQFVALSMIPFFVTNENLNVEVTNITMKFINATSFLTLSAVILPMITQASAWSCYCALVSSPDKARAPTYDCGKNLSGVSYDDGGFFGNPHCYWLSKEQTSGFIKCCKGAKKLGKCY